MSRLAPPLIAVLLAAAGTAAAQTPPRDDPTAVSPVTVMPPTLPPKVVASFPAQGQAIAPGVLILKVIFDQKMLATGFNYAPPAQGERPECLDTPRLLKDEKTFVLLCRVLSGRDYGFEFNAAPAGGFANQAENRALPHALSFQVARGEPVTSVRKAMVVAGLRADEEPIQLPPERQPVAVP